MRLFDHVMIKESGVRGIIVDVMEKFDDVYIVEDDSYNQEIGYAIYTCREDELEVIGDGQR